MKIFARDGWGLEFRFTPNVAKKKLLCRMKAPD